MKNIHMIERVLNADKRHMYRVIQKAKQVEALAPTFEMMSDAQLKDQTKLFKERLQKETLEDILPEAYAAVRESAKRVLHQYPYFVQLVGAVILHYGDIAEMKTGEGKTLTETMPIYLNALRGEGVHVVTTNDYLAQRDAQVMGEIYAFLGLTVGYNHRGLNNNEKRMQYACDITYTTNAELGFDFLRDGLVYHKEQCVLRSLHYALIDEVDSILIDEARTPLIISGTPKESTDMFAKADKLAKGLQKTDYDIDKKDKAVFLTQHGIDKAEKCFGIHNLYHPNHMTTVHYINQALKANCIMRKDVDYVVQTDEIVIVDEFTGRAMEGRNYSNGLHQAIEAKEGILIKQENATMATITYQNFFRLYAKLAGMSGTAKPDEQEFLQTYNMRVMQVETNRPLIRVDAMDHVYATAKEKYAACVEDVAACYQKGQPVLIGMAFIEDSERMSDLLAKRKIPHVVLNAKQHAEEARIVELAGQKNTVTIATNMAGRGTDIKLGEGVDALGGLAVFSLQRHESRRIDNQLKGRSGRQGDVGYSCAYVSLEDELLIRYANDEQKNQLRKHLDNQRKCNEIIDSVQRTVEYEHYYARRNILEYDDVMREQRGVIAQQREMIMSSSDPLPIIKDMMDLTLRGIVETNELQFKKREDYVVLEDSLRTYQIPMAKQPVADLDTAAICAEVSKHALHLYADKTKALRTVLTDYERMMMLQTMDRMWIEHVDEMMELKNGIHLRSYAQKKPVDAYGEEGFHRFKRMMYEIAGNIVLNCMQLQVDTSVSAPNVS